MNDSPDGFDRAPDRYMRHDRETVDRMRDLAHAIFGDTGLADLAFVYACLTHTMKYDDRAGLKGDANTDTRKSLWWHTMAEHVLPGTGVTDPRASRATYTPWALHAVPSDAGMVGTLRRLLARAGGADGHFVVGYIDDFNQASWTWAKLTQRERDQVRALKVGDIVDAVLPDGRIVREAVVKPDACGNHDVLVQLSSNTFVPLAHVRLPCGWKRRHKASYHDHHGLQGQRVPHTCPALRSMLLLINTIPDPDLRQRLQGHLELQRAYHAQLRRNQRMPPL